MISQFKILIGLVGGLAFIIGGFNIYLGVIFSSNHEKIEPPVKNMKHVSTQEKNLRSELNTHGNDDHMQVLPVSAHHDSGEHYEEGKSHQLITDPNHELPKWVSDYFDWHASIRKKFPGEELFTNPDAPKLIIRTCLNHQCGGLHDRLGNLPSDLYLANQTQRVLLIHWWKPYALDEFMVPPDLSTPGVKYSIDWRMPIMDEYGTSKCHKRWDCVKKWDKVPFLPDNVRNLHRFKDEESLTAVELLERGIHNLTKGELKDTRVVQFELLAHQEESSIQEKWKQLGETDMIYDTPSFGKIFLAFFTPSKPVQEVINNVMKENNLVSQQYTAVHCRVRHPFAYKKGQVIDGKYAAKADRYVPYFGGEFKDIMVDTAITAMKCAATITKKHNELTTKPYYFMSDMSELVDYMVFNLTDSKYISSHPEWFSDETSTNSTAKKVVDKWKIVAREQDSENLHIDKAKMTNVENYYSVFIDLFLGIHAKCVAYGVGYYAAFARKISRTNCVTKYMYEKYGGNRDNLTEEQKKLRCKFKEASAIEL